MDGEDANAGDFEDRTNLLKAIGDPIFFRLDELSACPAFTELARKYHNELSEIIRGLETNKPWIPKDRIDEVLSSADKLRKWLDEMQAEQDKTRASIEPVFTLEEVYDKLADLQAKVASASKIPKPKPKVEKAVKNETDQGKVKTMGSDGKLVKKVMDLHQRVMIQRRAQSL